MGGGGGWTITEKKKWLHSKQLLKYNCARGAMRKKKRACVFHYPGPVFDVLKRFLRKLFPPQNFMHNLKMNYIVPSLGYYKDGKDKHGIEAMNMKNLGQPFSVYKP